MKRLLLVLLLLLFSDPVWGSCASPVAGVDWFASPTGSGTDCSSTSVPCTPKEIWLNKMDAGDTMCLMDGTYTGADYMLHQGLQGVTLDCTLANPCTIQAINDGQVLIDGQDVREPAHIGRDYWHLSGFDIANSKHQGYGGNGIAVSGDGVELRRLCIWDADINNNGAVLSITQTDDFLAEDVCLFGTGKNVGSASSSLNTDYIFRRVFHRFEGSNNTQPKGAAQLSYRSHRGIAENIFSTAVGNLGIAGNENGLISHRRIEFGDGFGYDRDLQVLGSAAWLDDEYVGSPFSLAGKSLVESVNQSTTFPTSNHTYKDLVAYVKSTAPSASTIKPFFLQQAYTSPPLFTATNITSIGGDTDSIHADWTVTNHVDVTSPGDTNVYDDELCFQYVDGTKTATPLWPWAMDARMVAALQTAGYTGINVYSLTDKIEELFGTIPAACRTDGGGAPGSEFANGYSFRQKYSIDHTLVPGTTNFTDAVVAFKITNPNFRTTANGGKMEEIDAADLRIETLAGVNIPRTLLKYDAATGEVIGFMKLDINVSTDTEFYIYYGESGATGNEVPTTVFSEFAVAWMLNDAAAPVQDLGPNNYDSTVTGGDPVFAQPGKIHQAIDFDGTDDNFRFGNQIGTDSGTSDFSMGVWTFASLTQVQSEPSLYFDGAHNDGTAGKRMWLSAGIPRVDAGNGTSRFLFQGVTSVADDAWHYVVMSADRDGNGLTIIDGIQDDADDISGGAAYNTDSSLNVRISDASLFAYTGKLEFVWMKLATHSVDRARLEFNALNFPNTFISANGSEEAADEPDYTVSETGGTTVVSETGTTDTFSVVLTIQPATDVVFNVVSSDTGEATVDKATLTFTNANWATPQVVTVTGVDDALDDGAQVINVTISVDDANSDDTFDPLPDTALNVTVQDDDVGVTITESGGITIVTEGLDTDTYTIGLNEAPASNVDIIAQIDSQIDLGDGVGVNKTFTFTPANWATPQTVTVTPFDDNVFTGAPHFSTIIHSSVSGDTLFHNLTIDSVVVEIIDDDSGVSGPTFGGIIVR